MPIPESDAPTAYAVTDRSLFDVGSDVLALAALFEEIGGDVTEASVDEVLTAFWAENDANEAAKIDRYVGLIRDREARAARRRMEAKRVLALAERDDADVERLTGALHAHMLRTDRKKIETDFSRLRIQNNGGALPVVIEDAGVLPEAYCTLKVELSIPMGTATPETLDALREQVEVFAGEGYKAKTEVVPDKTAIAEALKAEEIVPGATFGERGSRLVIA